MALFGSINPALFPLLWLPVLSLSAWFAFSKNAIRLFQPAKARTMASMARAHWRAWLLILLAGACFCLPPLLSDDVHRYLWEGFVQTQGYSPYLHAPDSLSDHLDHPSANQVNHAHLTAIYPPLAQYLFRLSAVISSSIWGWRLVLLAWCALGLLLLSRRTYAYWLLSPLVLVEGWWHVHLDLLGVWPAFWFLDRLRAREPYACGLALALMTAIKVMPLMLAPLAFFHLVGKDRFRIVVATVVPLGLLYLPFYDHLPALFSSFITYSKEWYFNNPLFLGLLPLVGNQAARIILAILFLGLYGLTVFSRRDIGKRCLWCWLALIVTSPTVYPWYLLWLIPWLDNARRGYLHLAYAASFISYWAVYQLKLHDHWHLPVSLLLVEWLPLTYCFYQMATGPRTEPASPSQGTYL